MHACNAWVDPSSLLFVTNPQLLKEFAEDMTEKLTPIWYRGVQPWLSNHRSKLVQMLVRERRNYLARGILLHTMDFMRKHSMIEEIPDCFKVEKPELLPLEVNRLGEAACRILYWQSENTEWASC